MKPRQSAHQKPATAHAERLGTTERFIRRLTAENRVPFLKIGKFVRFDPKTNRGRHACRRWHPWRALDFAGYRAGDSRS